MGLVDYHVHTHLCGHCTGMPGDYIEAALGKNLIEIGFADHSPLPENLREGISMRPDETETYISLIQQAREEHTGLIAVKIGFEVDFPLQPAFDPRYLSDARLDYLIGSCHYIDGWAFDHPREKDEFNRRDVDEVYARYYRILAGLVSSRMFSIIGHFDLVKKFGHRPRGDFSHSVEEIARLCARYDTAVEINTAGLRKPVGEIYPEDRIIELLFTHSVPVTLGSDSHAPDEIAHCYGTAVEKIKKAGYTRVSGFSKRKRYDILL